MDTDGIYTEEQLGSMSRRELQALAKATQACKANAKTSAIVAALAAHYAAQADNGPTAEAAEDTTMQAPSEPAAMTDDEKDDHMEEEEEELKPKEKPEEAEEEGAGDAEAGNEAEEVDEEEEVDDKSAAASPASITKEAEGAGVTTEATQSPVKPVQRSTVVAPVVAAAPPAVTAAPRPKPTHSTDSRPRITPKAQGFKPRYSHVRAKVSTGRASAASASRSATRPTPTSGSRRVRSHSRKSFDLAASLRRKPTWKLKKGRVQPLELAEEDKRAQRPTIGSVRPRSALGSRNVNQAGAPSAKVATMRGAAARRSIYGR